MRKMNPASPKRLPPRSLSVIALMMPKTNAPARMTSWRASPCAAWKRVRVSLRGTIRSSTSEATSPM
jgi:hypothetical protein